MSMFTNDREPPKWANPSTRHFIDSYFTVTLMNADVQLWSKVRGREKKVVAVKESCGPKCETFSFRGE